MRFVLCALLAAASLGCGCKSTTEPAPKSEPIVFAFQKQKDPQAVRASAERVAARLSEKLGRPVEVMIPASYSATVQALVSNHAQLAYLSAIPYLLAKQEAPVTMLLAERRAGKTDYDSVFVVKKEAPYQTLADLRGARMMFTSATSTSGYVMAYARLVHDGLIAPRAKPETFFDEVNYAGSYDRALRAVLQGQADVCAVSDYTLEGPKADKYLTAEERAGLRILTRTSGVPTHLVAARTDLGAELLARARAALLELSQREPELLADVYGASELVRVDESTHTLGATRALEATGLALRTLVR